MGRAGLFALALALSGCDGGDDETESQGSDSQGTGTGTGTGTDTETAGSGSSGGVSDAVQQWCDCMLLDCHDDYHATWGDDHDASMDMCLQAGAAVPSAGTEVTEGDFIECRLWACQGAAEDPSLCEAAMGRVTCVAP